MKVAKMISKVTQMSWYRVPTASLIAIASPLDGAKWNCGAITAEDVKEAVEAGIAENRPWQEVNGNIPDDENRTYHLRRLATLMAERVENPSADPGEVANHFISMLITFENDSSLKNATILDGNHRVAVEFFLGKSHIDVLIYCANPDLLDAVFPGVEPIAEDGDQSALPDEAGDAEEPQANA